jgi:hypothetical protein
MRGADAMYYADDYAANPAVNSVPGGESSGVNVDGLGGRLRHTCLCRACVIC